MRRQRWSVGLIGFGYWGALVFDKLRTHERVTVAAIANRTRARLDGVALPGVRVTDDAAAVIRDPAIDLIFITTALPAHRDLLQACLEAGKPAFVTKPLVRDYAAAQELQACAERAGVSVFVDHTFLYTAEFAAVQRELASLSPPRALDTVRTQFGRFQDGSSVFWELLYHDVYLALAFADGAAPAAVSAHAADVWPPGDAQIASLRVSFGSGFTAFSHASMCSTGKHRRVVLSGREYVLDWDDSRAAGRVQRYPSSRRGQEAPIVAAYESSDAVTAEITDILDTLEAGRAPRCGLAEAAEVTRILAAAERSAASGGASVAL
jgi:myo-inositol 2-dehydrogenase/D-chiro-inositol 1-dehydrogenase